MRSFSRVIRRNGFYVGSLGPPELNVTQSFAFAMVLENSPNFTQRRRFLMANRLMSRKVSDKDFLWYNTLGQYRNSGLAGLTPQDILPGFPVMSHIAQVYEHLMAPWVSYGDGETYFLQRKGAWESWSRERKERLNILADRIRNEASREKFNKVASMRELVERQGKQKTKTSKNPFLPTDPSKVKLFKRRSLPSPNAPIHVEVTIRLKQRYVNRIREKYLTHVTDPSKAYESPHLPHNW